MKTLKLILGDQLNLDHSWFKTVDDNTIFCLFEMRQEIHIFLDSQNHEYSEHFVDFDWLSKLAYLADIFSHINDLNLMMQGNYFFLILFYFSNIKKEHILTIKAAIQTFFEYFKK